MLTRKVLSALFGLGFVLASESQIDKVVYDTDNRKDYYELASDNIFKSLTQQSICGMVGSISPSSGRYDTVLSSLSSNYRLGSAQDLCPDQKFYNDPAIASCSMTLIGPDRVLTAGHCVTGISCARRNIMFNYYVTSRDGSGYPSFPQITTDDFYSCKYVYSQLDDSPGLDFAVIQLDRVVTSSRHTPATIRSARTALSVGTSVTIIGSGSGIPSKIDQGGKVVNGRSSTLDYFTATTDSFAGNSGSGIFDTSGNVVGILVRGATDYVARQGSNCNVVNVVNTTTCSYCGEAITYAFHALDVIDCKTDSDCVQQTLYKSSKCSRSCAADSSACTGLCVPANFISNLACGAQISGNTYSTPELYFGGGGDQIYNFTLSAATSVSLTLCSTISTSRLTIVSTSDPTTSLSQCTTGCTCNTALSATLAAGSYMAVVDSTDGDGGSYTLALGCSDASASVTASRSPSSSPSPSPQFDIGCGDIRSASTVGYPSTGGQPSADHTYRFNLESITSANVTFDTCQSNFDTYLSIFNSNGTLVQACDDCGGCSTRANLTLTLVPGEYTVRIEGYQSANGSYVLSVWCSTGVSTSRSPSPSVGPLPSSATRSLFSPLVLVCLLGALRLWL